MDSEQPQQNVPEGKCVHCVSELKEYTIPMVEIGGRMMGKLRFYYCGNQSCPRYKALVKY